MTDEEAYGCKGCGKKGMTYDELIEHLFEEFAVKEVE